MKHPYQVECACPRCTKERTRRQLQASTPHPIGCTCDRCYKPRTRKRRAPGTRRPVPGSQEWAETRGDDIPSYDVPGDDERDY